MQPDPSSDLDRSDSSEFDRSAPATLFECDADLESLERVILAWCVHPEGAGFDRAWLLRWRPIGGLLEVASSAEARPDVVEGLNLTLQHARRQPPASPARPGWAVVADALDGSPADAWRRSASAWGEPGATPGSPWTSDGVVGAFALRRLARAHGLVVGAWAHAPSSRSAGTLETLRRFANAALASQTRAADARRRAQQATAVAELARLAVSPVNVAEAFHHLARSAAQATGVRGAAIWTWEGEEDLRVAVTHGPAALRDRLARGFEGAARAALEARRATSGEQAHEAPGIPPDVEGETSVWAVVPLLAYDRPLGAIGVWDSHDRAPSLGPLDRTDLEFLTTLADLAALVVEHGRQRDQVRESETRRRELGREMRRQERLAALGELAARVARDARNPLASISAFARRAHRAAAEDDPQREVLEIVIREAERLEAMMLEQSRWTSAEKPRLRLQDLNLLAQEALQRASEALVRRRVRLVKKLSPDLPMMLLDGDRIQRTIENVLAFALESVPLGGRIRVESRRAGTFVVLEIAHDGARQGGDLVEQLFVPFAGGSSAGSAVGLGMAHQVVREHGGEIRVRSEGEWGAVFALTLPVLDNQDRRRALDRRRVRHDRRRRADDGAV